MNSLAALLTAAVLAAPPQVELTSLGGGVTRGTLSKLDKETATLQIKEEQQEFPLKQVVRITFPDHDSSVLTSRDPLQITLTDGTKLYCKNISTSGRKTEIKTTSLSEFSISTQLVKSIMLRPEESALKVRWQTLLDRPRKRDALIIAKGEPGKRILDFVEGAVGNIGPEEVAFLLGDRNVTVNRDKLYGIIYTRNSSEKTAQPLCQALLRNKQHLNLSSLSFDGQKLQAELLTKAKITIPLESLQTLDYSLGKVAYLSDLTPKLELFANWHDLLSDRWLSLAETESEPASDGKTTPVSRFTKYSNTLTGSLAAYGRDQLKKSRNQPQKIDFLDYRAGAGKQVESIPFNESLAKFYRNQESLAKLKAKNASHFYYRRNHTTNKNQALSLGGKSYQRGLWIHSWTLLSYQLDGQYKKFQALMGIDAAVAANGIGDVNVIIRGDNRVILEADVSALDEPRQLDIDVQGVKQLEIEVGFGKNYAISDHLDLVEAKLLK